MTPGIVIVGGFLLIITAGVSGYYFERYLDRRWAEQAAERIWENRDKWLKRG
ncbi:hypothetical protein ADU18_0004 [Cronobacter phage PBES 02]|uniref:Uncharacterized protein n=1 Tax=Cronobacter phage PBES 02 TaxID=1684115 RepID=A0A0K1Y9W3_9CAUD|nr:hypothetical protein ADU18_0004 [Cronobacter phage PBES 02]AKY03910.1 hypothetical protein ADU18_0004 [Cronobacter phage PBES 02]